jgi:D-alanyl-D-alanine carboxypeptidase (penicillin-binding protein 5/6)
VRPGLAFGPPPLAGGVDAGKGDRHEGVPQRADLDGACSHLPAPPRDLEVPRRGSKREHALRGAALFTRPDEEACGTEIEASEAPDLHLERALDAPDARGLLVSDGLHGGSYSLRAVFRRLGPLVVLAAFVLAWAGSAVAAPPPRVAAEAVLVANGRTGEVLHARNADRRLAMASITKLMTAVVTLEHRRLRDTVTVAGPAPVIGGATIALSPGERLSVRDLLAAALIQSANDAAFALAADVGGGNVGRFVDLMNAEARERGLDDTHYARPDGLDAPGHYSSAEDSFQLARAAMTEPAVRRLVRKRTAKISGGRTLHTWNDLLYTFSGLVGVKTGHTNDAGWSEVAAARRHGTNIYAVILGSPSRARRNRDLAALLEWGFDQYGRVTLVRKGERYASAAIPFSDERVDLVAARGAGTIARLDEGTRFVERVVAPAMVDLPVERGEALGEVVVTLGDRIVARRPLVAARSVPEPTFREQVGWFADRALDEAESMLGSIFG